MDHEYLKLLKFSTKQIAASFYRELIDAASTDEYISVHDLYWMVDDVCDYTYDKYGWSAKDILNLSGVRQDEETGEWEVILPEPQLLEAIQKCRNEIQEKPPILKKRVPASSGRYPFGCTRHEYMLHTGAHERRWGETDEGTGVVDYDLEISSTNIRFVELVTQYANELMAEYCKAEAK